MTLSPVVSSAIKSGPTPVIRDISKIPLSELTLGERVVSFAHNFLHVPEGMHTGKPLVLDEWQIAFILAIFDNPARTRTAICSLARRNGKSFVVAVILLAYILGPLAKQNVSLASGALTRDQSALIYRLCEKMLNLSPRLHGLYRCVPSSKKIIGLAKNTEYKALSADGASNLGNSFNLILLDEAGQIKGPSNPFTEMLETSQGSFSEEQMPLMIILSTQAPSDADYLSIKIDDATRIKSERTVCHLYAADENCEILDKKQWRSANPGLGKYRSEKDLEEQLKQASRLSSMEASVRNLLLNQRIALESLWLSPAAWKSCGGKPNIDVFRRSPVSMGLDLSTRTDLTAAVCAAADDEGAVHLLPFVFTPMQGLEDRARRDRAPYQQWVKDGLMIAVPGASVDYDYVAQWLRGTIGDLGFDVSTIEFDRWRWELFKKEADAVGFASFATWNPVGQGFKDFSPRVEAFEALLLSGKLRHGSHPLLNLAASNAIVVRDAAGSRKIDKSKSTMRIDPLVAALMASFPVSEGVSALPFDVEALIG